MIEVTIEDAPVTAIMSGDSISVTFSEVGETGPAGAGVPTGGTAGQILTKNSAIDDDTSWQDPALINHNDTLNIQGGVTGEHYHLTAADYANNLLKGDVAGGNYTDIDEHGHQTMHGDARAWRDALGDALSLKAQGAGVSTNVTESVVEFTASADLNDYLYSNLQLNHDRDEAEAIFPHIHWFQAANSVPNFLLQYRWQKDGGTKATAWDNLPCITPSFPYVSGTIHQICHTASGITPPSGSMISDIVQFRVLRDTGNASGLFAADPYTGSVGILSFDTHIMVNSIGSDEQYLK